MLSVRVKHHEEGHYVILMQNAAILMQNAAILMRNAVILMRNGVIFDAEPLLFKGPQPSRMFPPMGALSSFKLDCRYVYNR